MSQDNKEAASAPANEAECRKACDICFDEAGNEWPCVKAKTGKFAASASQSSTAGAAKGGITNNAMPHSGFANSEGSGSGHIAPQAAADTGAVVDLILAYGAACTVMDERAPAIMEAIKRALAAVPPAKAEGLTDEQICATALEHGYGIFGGDKARPFTTGDQYGQKMLGFVRAILAQQAKKGGAA